ncbi:hypothetical protein HY630_01490 [Candidatus Uhrbacteria bacterium]|nr:hypothetical protein [Candidatus Uhrbacteria bacterium]
MLKKAVVLSNFSLNQINPPEGYPMFKLLLMALCLMIPQVANAACEESTHVAQLGDAGRTAEQAFAALDAEALLTQASLVRTQILPCVDEPLTKEDAAAFHRLMAMEAFIGGNYTRAKQELHASLLLQPGYAFPEDVAGEGHPLLALYKAAETMPDGDGEKIYPPPGGYVLVGGVRNSARYSLTPVIIQVYQVVEEVDTLRETRYVQPGEATPNWSGNAFGLTAQDLGINLDELQRPRVLRDPRPWFVASGIAAAVGGVLYGVAMSQKDLYQDPNTADGDLAGLQSRANALGTVSLISGGTALVCTGFGIGFTVKFGPHKAIPTPHSSDAIRVGAPTGASGEAASP